MPAPLPDSSLPTLELRSGARTDQGRRRDHNEDRVLCRPDLGLFAVADGAGGHDAGDVASALAIETLQGYFQQSLHVAEGPPLDAFGISLAERRLAIAVHRANRAVADKAVALGSTRGMGTTLVALTLPPGQQQVCIAHVGDSRCYRLRAGLLENLTRDHSIANDVVELRPEITDEELAAMPRRAVTRALGMASTVRVSMQTLGLVAGDRYLLCSDGLYGELPDGSIRQILLETPSVNDAAGSLIAFANQAGGKDNISAVIVDCVPAGPRPRAPSGARWVGAEATLEVAAAEAMDDDELEEIERLSRDVTGPSVEVEVGEVEVGEVGDEHELGDEAPESARGTGELDADGDLDVTPARAQPAHAAAPRGPLESGPAIEVGHAATQARRRGEDADEDEDELMLALGATVVCRACRLEFEADGIFCPHCGAQRSAPLR